MQLTNYLVQWLLFGLLWVGIKDTIAQPSSLIQLIREEVHPYFGTIGMEAEAAKGEAVPFQVFPRIPKIDDLPMLGHFENKDGWLYFRPRFPFIQDRTYWVKTPSTFNAAPNALIPIYIPKLEDFSHPNIIGIYPSGNYWPSNQLKIYLNFDQPMRFGEALQHLKLFDESGEEIFAPFLELGQELWDKSQQRLTIWFDPGRIKTGLIPFQKYGPPLKDNHHYQLRISKEWLAMNGLGLTADFIKYFRTGPKDTAKPNPMDWQIENPQPGSLTPLVIHFPEPLDYALLQTALLIVDYKDIPINGKCSIGTSETAWYWHPDQPWTAGTYKLKINKDLEDLAGNNLERLFDTNVTEIKNQAVGSPEVQVWEIEIHIQ